MPASIAVTVSATRFSLKKPRWRPAEDLRQLEHQESPLLAPEQMKERRVHSALREP